MKYIALSGHRHNLRRYFTPEVTCVDSWKHTPIIPDEPTTLIGFSLGAEHALQLASQHPQVQYLYLHSIPFTPVVPPCPLIRFFVTRSDKTPTYQGTFNTYAHLLAHDYIGDVTLTTLSIFNHEPIRNLATFLMWLTHHQFHNCLRYLPRHIVNPDYLP